MAPTKAARLADVASAIEVLDGRREAEVERRDALIVALRGEGVTLHEIGRIARLSHTQVDNIVRRVKKSLQPT